MKTTIIAAITIVLLIAIFIGIGISHSDMPGRTPYLVNDYAGVLNIATKEYLESLLKYVRDKGSRHTEVVVTIFKSLNGKPFDEFFRQYLARWWRWSIVENHNRIQIVIVTDAGKVRVGVGRPLDKIIDGPKANDIIHTLMLPRFTAGDYSTGTRVGVEAIIRKLEKR